MILEAKIDKKTHSKTDWILESIVDAFCFIFDLIFEPILHQKRLEKIDQILWKNSKSSPGDPTPQIYTTGAVYKSGGTPGEGLGRGKNNNM